MSEGGREPTQTQGEDTNSTWPGGGNQTQDLFDMRQHY